MWVWGCLLQVAAAQSSFVSRTNTFSPRCLFIPTTPIFVHFIATQNRALCQILPSDTRITNENALLMEQLWPSLCVKREMAQGLLGI